MIYQGFFNVNVRAILGFVLVDMPQNPQRTYFYEQAIQLEYLGHKIPGEDTVKKMINLEKLYNLYKANGYFHLCTIVRQTIFNSDYYKDGEETACLIKQDCIKHLDPWFYGNDYLTKLSNLVDFFNLWVRKDVCEHKAGTIFETKVSRQQALDLFNEARGIE